MTAEDGAELHVNSNRQAQVSPEDNTATCCSARENISPCAVPWSVEAVSSGDLERN